MEINPFIRQEIETKWKDNFRLEGDILYLINDDFCGQLDMDLYNKIKAAIAK